MADLRKSFLRVTVLILTFSIKCVVCRDSCPAIPETRCGAPELVDAGATGSISIKPVIFVQNHETECNREEVREYRTADGSCNHAFNLGSAETPLRRLLPPAYDDGANAPRTHGVDGFPLPPATEVSRSVHVDRNTFGGFSLMFMQWGQFMDHDIALSPVLTEIDETLHCCGPDGRVPEKMTNSECMPIILDKGDNRFHGRCMEFARSIGARSPTGKKMGVREQINSVTAFVDGSMIYGSSEELQRELRETIAFLPGAMMKMHGDLLPQSPDGHCDHRPGLFCFLAGDTRVNEQPGLIVIHTIWVRLHNIIASKLRPFRPRDSEEQLFQLTRKIVVAILQHIHYGEWLPRVVGPHNMWQYNLWPWRRVGYSASLDPRLTNAFSTAAFRFGHSMIPRQFNISGRIIPLRKLFNRPDVVFDDFKGVMTSLFSSTSDAQSQAQRVDAHIVDEVTGHLFEPDHQKENEASRGLDLVALNIQRGRDHGLPPYNEYRKLCGLSPLNSFNELGREEGQKLASIYRNVEDVDLFTGALLEKPLPRASVGPTFGCIISQQFHALKFGDRFFYETARQPEGFTDNQLSAIRQMTYAHVCCQMDEMDSVAREAFLAPSPSNRPVPCSQLRDSFLDLSLWQDESETARPANRKARVVF